MVGFLLPYSQYGKLENMEVIMLGIIGTVVGVIIAVVVGLGAIFGGGGGGFGPDA
ncbi:hypothetical protein FACS189496_1080 [Bacilli bacterium]|nr:hypothetical protein FACS189496_1080 [Bacilli bacterium]